MVQILRLASATENGGALNKPASVVLGIVIISSLIFGQSAAPEKVTSPETTFTYWTPETGQWMEDPDAPGTYGKNVTGSAATGNWVMYVKINPGAWINWHWHSNSQTLYAVGGTMEYEVRPHKTVKLIPGSYLVVPGHALHNGTCISKEPCLFFIENLLPNDKHMTDASGNEVKRH